MPYYAFFGHEPFVDTGVRDRAFRSAACEDVRRPVLGINRVKCDDLWPEVGCDHTYLIDWCELFSSLMQSEHCEPNH
jgi:hypothetical protein